MVTVSGSKQVVEKTGTRLDTRNKKIMAAVVKQFIENEYVRLTTVIAVIVAAVGFARYDIQTREEVKHSIRELSVDVNFKIDKIETKIDLAAREHWTKADMMKWSTRTEHENENWKAAEIVD